jgi:hypothetical protein
MNTAALTVTPVSMVAETMRLSPSDRLQPLPEKHPVTRLLQHLEVEGLRLRRAEAAFPPDPRVEIQRQPADGFLHAEIGGGEAAGGHPAHMSVEGKQQGLPAQARGLDGRGDTRRSAAVNGHLALAHHRFALRGRPVVEGRALRAPACGHRT